MDLSGWSEKYVDSFDLKILCNINKVQEHGWVVYFILELLNNGSDYHSLYIEKGESFLHACIRLTLATGMYKIYIYTYNQICEQWNTMSLMYIDFNVSFAYIFFYPEMGVGVKYCFLARLSIFIKFHVLWSCLQSPLKILHVLKHQISTSYKESLGNENSNSVGHIFLSKPLDQKNRNLHENNKV